MAKTDDVTADFIRQVLDYNPETGILTRRYRPDKPAHTNTRLANKPIKNKINGDGYICVKIDGVNYLAHRLAFLHYYGYLPHGEIDHRNMDKADNRICNLREATHTQNQYNRTAYRCNSTGLKGVNWRESHKKWRATIRINGKPKHLGYFDTAKEAHEAYKKAALVFHKDFARLG